jgi:putative DNA primase/helicase
MRDATDPNVAHLDAARAKRTEERGAAPSGTVPEIVDSDMANARRLAERHGSDIRYTPERGFLVWDGRRWSVDERSIQIQALAKDTARGIFEEIERAADQAAMFRHARRSQSKNSIEAMVTLVRSEPGICARLVDFDADPWLLSVANGTLDLRTGNLRPHAREDLITRLVDVTYDPDAECELWDGFLWRITGQNDELYAYLQRLVGYLLTGLTTEQVLHFLFGLGANGKSTFCEIIERLLGDYAIVVSPEMVMQKRHGGIPNDVARLRGVRVAMMNETSQGARFNEAKLKDLTGGDTLNARFLHQEFFDFAPTHKLVIRGNHKPAISGTDPGIWRRLRLVPFTVQIPTDEQDHRLLEKLHAELPGILRWAVIGCRQWQEIGLKPPAVITDAVADYREESDTLGRFIEEHCEAGANKQCTASAFFRRYQDFCQRAGERSLPSKDLPDEMRRRGFEQKRVTSGKLYLGIALAAASDGHDWSDR